MKTKRAILKLLIVLCTAFVTTAVFGQVANYAWTGAANGTNLDTPGNFTTNGVDPAVTLPSGNDGSGIQESVIWDGRTTTNLNLTHAVGWPGTGLGSFGVNLVLTANQTNDVRIISPGGASGQINTFGITNNSANAAFILGNNTANQLEIITRPGIAGTVHHFVNNSTNAAVINSSVQWLTGGGVACVLSFGGTGNWTVNHNLRANNLSGPYSVELTGPGSMTWSNGGVFVSVLGPITILGGTMILKSAGLALNFNGMPIGNNNIITNNDTIANNGTLQYDAAAQADTIARVISGTGLLKVSNGTLMLTGTNTYTGGTTISGGTLQVGTNGTSGSLGSGYVTNNSSLIFNHSDSVTFGNAISGTGSVVQNGSGTLALTGANTYGGNTTVNAGKLVILGTAGSGNIAVADGAALGVNQNGARITPGTLTLGTSSGCTLEFNNVNSTTTAAIAAGTISSAGTVTVKINSGSLNPGNSYALLAWTTGSAPAVSLGVLNGFIGNLSFSDNTLLLNVTAVNSPTLNFTQAGNSLQFSWSGSFKLLAQTNGLNVGIYTNWGDYPGGGASPVTVPVEATKETVFFRLVSPE